MEALWFSTPEEVQSDIVSWQGDGFCFYFFLFFCSKDIIMIKLPGKEKKVDSSMHQ